MEVETTSSIVSTATMADAWSLLLLTTPMVGTGSIPVASRASEGTRMPRLIFMSWFPQP